MPLFDACVGRSIELVHVRHEAAAVHMADAWGRLTGSPGVALVTAGPGFANTLSALYVAAMAESPMVLLSGHAPTSRLGQAAFQEMPQAYMARHVSKASWTAESAAGLAGDMTRALRIAASGRPGPVHVALPVDLLEAEVVTRTGAADWRRPPRPHPTPTRSRFAKPRRRSPLPEDPWPWPVRRWRAAARGTPSHPWPTLPASPPSPWRARAE